MYSSHWYHNTWQITFLCIHCQTSVSPRPMRAAGGPILMYSSHYKIHDKVFGQNIFWCIHRITKIHGKVYIDWAFYDVFTDVANCRWFIAFKSALQYYRQKHISLHCTAMQCNTVLAKILSGRSFILLFCSLKSATQHLVQEWNTLGSTFWGNYVNLI